VTSLPSEPEVEVAFGPACTDDIDALVSIDAGSPRPWTTEAFSTELAMDPPTLFALKAGGQVVAFVVARIAGPQMDILNLAVARDHRRRGLGRKLLTSLLDHAAPLAVQTAFLEVREGNLEARSLYGSVGFIESQRRRAFYKDPVEDAVLLRLQMSPSTG
jgi:ribosomal-protein-alanine N-acetyltransferase